MTPTQNKPEPITAEKLETLVDDVLKGKREFASIDFNDAKQVECALTLLKKSKAYIRQLDLTNPLHHKFVIDWLSNGNETKNEFWRKIENLDKAQVMTDAHHDNEILSLCLQYNLVRQSNSIEGFSTLYSFSNEIIMKVAYGTAAGEEIVYHDKSLDLPTTLVVKSDIAFKVVDSYKFMKYIDVHYQQLVPQIVYMKLIPDITSALRASILSVIDEKQLSYYELSKHYEEITDKVNERLNSYYINKGLSVANTYLVSIRIPSDIAKILEEKKLQSMQIIEDVNIRTRAERLSLENYEIKASIHKKYPEFAITLTEQEKNNAIERYNIKQGKGAFHKIKEVEIVGLDERDSGVEVQKPIVNGPDKIPEPELKKLKETTKGKFLGFGIGAIVLAIILFAVGAPSVTGIIALVAGIVLGGIYVWDVMSVRKENVEINEQNEAAQKAHAAAVAAAEAGRSSASGDTGVAKVDTQE